MTGRKKRSGGISGAGFSLVEVVLAMGVVTFALMAILGLLANVMTSSKESQQSTENCMLFQEVVNQLRIKPFREGQDGGSSVFPLPPLNVPGEKREFFVDVRNEFVGLTSGAFPKDAKHAIAVMVLNAQNLGIRGSQRPPMATDGRLALVRVEITPASAFQAGAKGRSKVYVTEVIALNE